MIPILSDTDMVYSPSREVQWNPSMVALSPGQGQPLNMDQVTESLLFLTKLNPQEWPPLSGHKSSAKGVAIIDGVHFIKIKIKRKTGIILHWK